MITKRTLAGNYLRKYAFIPTIIWAIALGFLMLLPSDRIPESQLLTFDKINHLIAYGLLSFLIALGYRLNTSTGVKRKNVLTRAVSLSIIYGTILELLQYYVPGRALEFYDLIANVMGCLFGILIFNIFQQNKFVCLKLLA